MKALKMHETSEKSYVEIANELRMKNSSHIAQWKMQYQNEGIAGLSKKRGRPKMSENEKPPNRNKAANNLLVDEKDKRIKELEYEVRLLKIKMNTWNYSGVWGKKKRRKNKNHPQTPRLIQTDRDSCRYRRIDAELRKRGIIIMSICLNYHEAIIK